MLQKMSVRTTENECDFFLCLLKKLMMMKVVNQSRIHKVVINLIHVTGSQNTEFTSFSNLTTVTLTIIYTELCQKIDISVKRSNDKDILIGSRSKISLHKQHYVMPGIQKTLIFLGSKPLNLNESGCKVPVSS
ncbi:unnamed protein product [Heterobilharzia americana]|nr:unnamed protein product [Heterobilharzia americana]